MKPLLVYAIAFAITVIISWLLRCIMTAPVIEHIEPSELMDESPKDYVTPSRPWPRGPEPTFTRPQYHKQARRLVDYFRNKHERRN